LGCFPTIELPVQNAPQVWVGASPHKLVHDFSIFQQQQSRDGTDAVLDRYLGEFFHVDFGEVHSATILGGQSLECRSEPTAGCAPFRPEINQDRLGARFDLVPFSLPDVPDVSHFQLLSDPTELDVAIGKGIPVTEKRRQNSGVQPPLHVRLHLQPA
jgi:hypothetical protein